jgi:MoaA/NifB/PqqE/SkfB family radical SAM enzyme
VTDETPWIGPSGQRMRRLELHVTYTCPERCVFCSEDHRMKAYNPFPVTLGRVVRILREHAERGVEAVHLTGGEPTIHPDFVDILKVAKKLGMRTSMGTIGTGLANPAFAERAMPYLDDVLFSLHGPDAETHDALTRRPGSFAKLMRAVENASRKSGFRPSFNTVLTQRNLAALPDTAGLVASLGAGLLIVSNTTPEGLGEDDYPALTVRLSEIRAVAPEVVRRAGSTVVRFFGVPLCALRDVRMFSNDLHWDPRVTVEWASHPGKVSMDPVWSWTPERKRTWVAACDTCAWKGLCAGVFARYVELHGDGEIGALTATGEAA